MRRLLLAVSLLIATAVAPSGQSFITGQVVADDTGEPIPNARILLDAASNVRTVVLTDDKGRFSLPATPGRHGVVATKTRFARTSVPVSAGARPVEIRLPRAAVISGRVIDAGGDPVIRALVTLEALNGSATTIARTETDDRGEYRLGGLSAGTYVVAVTTMGGPVRREMPVPQSLTMRGNVRLVVANARHKTYYPDAASSKEAQPLRLDAGDERPGVDLVLPFDRSGDQPFGVLGFGFNPIPRPAPTVSETPGIIRGRVSSRGGGGDLPHAVVRIDQGGPGRDPTITRAGPDARFEVRDLPPSTYRIRTSKAGHFAGTVSTALKAGETRDVDVVMTPWGTLEGRVFDELGDPIQGARVELLHVRYQAGRRRLVPASSIAPTTDDLGSYRVFGLEPGQYIVSAEVGGVMAADLPGYARTYYPGTATPAEAQFVTIGRFPDVTGIDFALSRTRTARVTGRFVNANGEPGGGSLMLMPSHQSLAVTNVAMNARIFPDGRFEFPNVPPGDYVIQANRGRSNNSTEGEFGALRVAVSDSDVDGLLLRTSTGSSVRGRLSFHVYNGSKEPSPSSVEISTIPADPDLSPTNNLATASIGAGWTFTLEGINGPRRLDVVRVPDGWTVKEVRVGGVDVTDRVLPFGTPQQSLNNVEIVLTDRINELLATVRDARGRPPDDAVLVAFSTDRAHWYPRSRFVRRAAVTPEGTGAVSGLPFGSYYVAAVGQVPSDGEEAWQDPAYLESLIPRSTSVVLGDGQKASVSLRVATP